MTALRLRGLALPLALLAAGPALQGCGMMQQAVAAAAGNTGTATAGVASGSARLDVVNNASQSVYSMQASACSDGNWGPDRLGSDTIPSGTSMSFDLTPGCWDFRADFDADHSNGDELVQRNVQIGGGSAWTWSIGG